MRTFQFIQVVLISFSLSSCKNDDKETTLNLGKGKDVTVSLNILDSKGIDKVEFTIHGERCSVKENELAKYKTINFGFNGAGEGTVEVLVYTKVDTLKSEYYVEGGYHVKLECDSSQINTIDGY